MLFNTRKRQRHKPSRRLGVETLESRQLLAADIRITEFLASNQNGLADGDGQTSDWIEVHNAESQPVNLLGWHLSDEPSNPVKWTFPDVEILSGGYLVVFASGQSVDDYVDPAGNLHTNFSLSAAGEYIGLISPELETVSAFGPGGTNYPPQEPDGAFGVGEVRSPALIEAGSAATLFVPSNNQLGLTWTGALANEPFDDAPASGWQATNLGIGYDTTAIEATSTETIGNTLIARPTTDGAVGSIFALESSPFANVGSLSKWSLFTQSSLQITPMILRFVDDGGYEITGIGQTRLTLDEGAQQYDFELVAGSSQVGPGYFFGWKDGANGANNGGVAPFDTTGLASVRYFGTHTSFALGESLGVGQGFARTYSIQAAAEYSDAPSPIGYWSFDNGALDESGHGADGEIRGPTASDDVPAAIGRGQSLDFDGLNDYVSVAIDVSEVAYTTSFWFRADAAGRGLFAVVDGDLGSGGHDRHIYLNGGNIATRVWNTETIVSSGQNFADGEWHHLAHVFGQGIGGQRVYIDGQIVVSGTKSQSDFDWQKRINIGFSNDAAAPYFDGRIDDVAVWSQELSELQIQALAAGASPLALAGLSGQVTSDVESAVRDVNASAYLRTTFDVVDPSAFNSVLLRMKYDDGFVAYLNGVEIARRNAPAALAFDAAAASDRPTSQAVRFEDLSLAGAAGLLRAGTNILAFQALNDSAASENFLLLPELFLVRAEDGLYLTTPTPGAPNAPGVSGFIAAPTLSHERGFYTAAFDLTLQSVTPGATIVYTTDGSTPSETNGTRIEPANATTTPVGTIHIDGLTNLRTAAIKTDFASSDVETHTFLFVSDVASQPILPAGYPATWAGGVAGNYEVDPDVVNSTLPGYSLEDSLLSIPTLSITTEFDNFWGTQGGIYYNTGLRGINSEVTGSLELIYPDGTIGFQVEAGFRPHGNSSRSHGFTPKHPLRVYFRSEYGDSKLVFPLFGEEAAIEFDHILLRGASTDSFPVVDGGARWLNERGTYLRDQWYRDTQLAMGQVASHGTYVHLYINGLYWGLYNPSERPTDAFQASYFGGSKDEYDVLKDFAEIDSGNKDAWNAMFAMASLGLETDEAFQRIQGNNPDGSRNPDYPVYMDADSLIDYMILHIYGGSEDWPHHNWWAARRRGPESEGFQFFSWDQEISNESLTRVNSGVGIPFEQPYTGGDGPSKLYGLASQNAAFRDRFANRVHELLFNDGLLTVENSSARWQARQQEIDVAIVAESARWGDTRDAVPFKREVEWLAEMEWMQDTYWEQNLHRVLDRFRNVDLYPDVEAPTFNQHGGDVATDFQLSMAAAAEGAIYYTLDGIDPLLPGGILRAEAILYAGSITLGESTRVLARARYGEAWSATNAATFVVNGAPLEPVVVINEVHYDPDVKTEGVEFVELYNAGSVQADLSGWEFSSGIRYTFPAGAILPPGGYLVVSQNPQALQTKFGAGSYGPFEGSLSADGERIELTDSLGNQQDQVDYQLGFPWPTVGSAPGPSIQLVQAGLDNDLGGSWRSALPTPGAASNVQSDNAAPQMRQVSHLPQQPVSGQEVTVTVKVTDPDGVASVVLAYQLVEAGDYIAIDDPRYAINWTPLEMHDDGLAGDAVAGDDVYSVVMPGSLQTHRHLVRYRIEVEDTLGEAITGPYADDPQPNFAYYVYDGVPDWSGSAQPGVAPEVTYNSELLESVPVYQLITTRAAHEDAQFIPDSDRPSGYTGSDYLWHGALVYNGIVYDHVTYRARGGVWRYAMGKNMWKFDFNKGHSFQAYDDYGQPYATKWDKLNFSAVIQQGNYLHRGEQGLFESVGFKLFNLAGVESPNTNFSQFRIVESADENGTDQYSGDFQGLYLAVEQPDGNFLDEHGLPDGNLYKMESGTGTLNNQGPTQPSDRSDLDEFLNTYNNTTPTEEWWRENLDLESYFSYRAIVEGIHHYDIAGGKNYYYYHDPETGLWSVHAWDLDLTWADNMFGSGNEPFNSRVAQNNAFNREYQNRLREIRDLLYNSEQVGMLIDEMARLIYTPGELSLVDADRALWDYNPILASSYTNPSKAGQGRYYESSATDDFAGMMQLMKEYVVSRGNWIDQTLLTDDAQLPATPVLTSAAPIGFPVNQLAFHTSDFTSPSAAFAGIEWRIAEVTDTASPDFDPNVPRKYEIEATWESGTLDEFKATMNVPADAVEPGLTYRVRARVLDDAGRFSHWSEPIQFVAGEATGAVIDGLRIAEINYHPHDPTPEELSIDPNLDTEDFEFVELVNIGAQSLDLAGARFANGVEFQFSSAQPVLLAPGARAVVVKNIAAHIIRYGDETPVAGQFFSGSLRNSGEIVALADNSGVEFLAVDYRPDGNWPSRADGIGSSLEIVSLQGDIEAAENWRASSEYGGSPGFAGAGPRSDVVVNEVLTHTDPPQSDSVELHNTTNAAIDVSGWFLSDSTSFKKFQLPSGSILAAGGYLVFDEEDFNPGLGANSTDFSFNGAHGDEVWLLAADANGKLTQFVDDAAFGAAANGESFGRWPNGSGALWPMSEVTLNGLNSGPRVGPLVISEIMFNPPDPDASGPVEPDDLEFVEIYNSTSDTVSFDNWQVRGGIDFDFPLGASIAPQSAVVLVPFDPLLDTALRDQFISFYQVDPAIVMFGPYAGKLANGGEELSLLRPDEPPADEPDFIPLLLEDRVQYLDEAPWPEAADGDGASLTRLGSSEWSGDPRRWRGDPPTPGTFADHSVSVRIVGVQPTESGFELSLLRDIDLSQLNLYDGIDPEVDLADVTLTGARTGSIAGSLLWNGNTQTVSFVKTGGPLEPDTYTLTVASRADGLLDLQGEMLDGDGDGQAGGDFVSQFVVADRGARWLSLPDFARGPRQFVRIDGNFGIPISIDNGANVRRARLELRYDATALQVLSISAAPSLPNGWKVDEIKVLGNGHLRLTISGTTPLAAGPHDLAVAVALVPDAAPIGAAREILIESVELNDGDLFGLGTRSVQAVGFLGDPSNSNSFTGFDASLIARVTVGLDTGFDEFSRIDPVLLGDVTGNGRLSALDASYVARKSVGLNQPEIPDIPASLLAPLPAISAPPYSPAAPHLVTAEMASAPVAEQVAYEIQAVESALTLSGSATLNGIQVVFSEIAPGSLSDTISGTILAELTGTTLTFAGGSVINPDPHVAGPFTPTSAETGSGGVEDNFGGRGTFLGSQAMRIIARDLLGDLLNGSAEIGGPVTGIEFDVTAGTFDFQEFLNGGFGFFDAGVEIEPAVNQAAGTLDVISDGTVETISIPVNVTFPFDTATNLGNVTGTVTLTGRIVARRTLPPPVLQVIVAVPNRSGVAIEFSSPLSLELLNLFDGPDAAIDLADLLLVGETTGAVQGSLHWDDAAQTLHFVKSGGPLLPDTYTLTLFGRQDGFVDLAGHALDGDDDGGAGGNYTKSFSISASSARVLSIPDLVRGPAQRVELLGTDGLPIQIDEGAEVTSVALSIGFDPQILDITEVLPGGSMPDGWAIDSVDRGIAGRIDIVLSGTTALPAGPANLIVLQSRVPESAVAGSTGVVSLSDVQLNEGTLEAVADLAFQVVAFLADASGSGDYSALDASLIARAAIRLDTGFDAFPRIDPRLIGDATGDGTLSALDASIVARKAVNLPQSEIPDLPTPGLAAPSPGQSDRSGQAIRDLRIVDDPAQTDAEEEVWDWRWDDELLELLAQTNIRTSEG